MLNEDFVLKTCKRWAVALNAHDIDQVVSFYDSEAVLWGTFARIRKTGSTSLKEYFLKLCSRDHMKVEFIDQDVRIYGEIALSSGVYAFSWKDGHRQIRVPARFSMSFRLDPEGLKIIDHHSSLFPPEVFDPKPFEV